MWWVMLCGGGGGMSSLVPGEPCTSQAGTSAHITAGAEGEVRGEQREGGEKGCTLVEVFCSGSLVSIIDSVKL